jgi:hypothetical protein
LLSLLDEEVHACENCAVKKWKWTPRELIRAIPGLVKQIPHQIVLTGGMLAQMAGEFGVIPFAILAPTFAVTYTAYSVVTETIETLFFGPVHWACSFFQMVYLKLFGLVLDPVVKMKEFLLRVKASPKDRTLWERLKSAFATTQKVKELQKALVRVSIESEPFVYNNKAFTKLLQARGASEAEMRVAKSSLWSGLLSLKYSPISGYDAAPADDFSYLVESFEAVQVLDSIVTEHLNEMRDNSSLSWGEYFSKRWKDYFSLRKRLGNLRDLSGSLRSTTLQQTADGQDYELVRDHVESVLNKIFLLYLSVGMQASDEVDLEPLDAEIKTLRAQVKNFVVPPLVPIRTCRMLIGS